MLRHSQKPLLLPCWTRLSVFLCLSLAALTASAAQSQTAPPQKWALLIGIDQYKDSNRISNLGSAAADARAIKKALVEADGFPADNVRLLVSDADENNDAEVKPDYNAILRELARLAKEVQPGDTVFVFFSGHGIERNDASYLLPYDTDAFNEGTLTDTAIPVTRFRDRLQSIHASLLLLAFDMCRNSPLKGSRDASGAGNTLKAAQVRGLDFSKATAGAEATPAAGAAGPRAVVTLFSCSPEERSYEWVDKGRGYFSWFLEQGLRGAKGAIGSDGAVHADTLTQYLSKSVPEAVRQGEGKTQTPFAEISGQIAAGQSALSPLGASAPKAGDGGTTVQALATDARAYLKVTLVPEDAVVIIDGVRQYPIAGRIAVNLGGQATKPVEVGVEAADFQSKVVRLTLTHGTVVPLTVTLDPRVEAAALPPPAPVAVSAQPTVAIGVTEIRKPPPTTGAPDTLRSQADIILWTNPPQQWMLVAFGGAQVHGTVDAGVAKIDVTAIDGTWWHVGMSHAMPTLKENATYRVTFDARADVPRVISTDASVGAGDYHNIGLPYAEHSLDTTWRTFSRTFVASRTDRLESWVPKFEFGTQRGAVWIRNVSVEEIGSPAVK